MNLCQISSQYKPAASSVVLSSEVSHDDFVQYLVGKAPPGRIQVARLGFEGKDTVVYATGFGTE
jgi:hypothetical protein